MSLLVPSKSPKAQNLAAGGAGVGVGEGVSGEQGTGAAGPTAGGPGAAAGGATGAGGTGGQAGRAGVLPGRTTPCTDRPDQVKGDPYSPPCIAFSGDNGGVTSKGVTGNEIHVAF